MHESIATTLGLRRRIFSVSHKSFYSLSSVARDGVNSILFNAVFNLIRKLFATFGSWISSTCTVTATFESGNEAFDWIGQWLERKPNYTSSRVFDVIPRPRASENRSRRRGRGRGRGMHMTRGTRLPKDESLAIYLPSYDICHWMFHGSYLMRVKRSRGGMGGDCIERITITMISFSRVPLEELIETAAQEYRARDLAEIQIYIGNQSGGWTHLSSKLYRDFRSVVLEPKVKRQLLEDTSEFLNNERWYADRGIPYRRGYLLYGTPGSGKSSSIHALASELRLDIYIVPLSLKAINDTILADLISNTPGRCILLYEDIDAAFPNRSITSTTKSTANSWSDPNNVSGVTLSGLLNTIDGVQAQEGRLLFATTNHPELLDPALSRPVEGE
ncbi:unnamed protein product [Rhizoctonia solani]|uniref:BCS1 N-terminal domain-containing protein n=1 Tax=Rhizoctonia solani TaxID=456999 RepID=A0A8H2XZV7_9AGAM|nr:unnamed protein product [Rhizoctonia solani]